MPDKTSDWDEIHAGSFLSLVSEIQFISFMSDSLPSPLSYDPVYSSDSFVSDFQLVA